jgi:hypothetical protein
MVYGNKKKNGQIAGSPGQSSFADGQKLFGSLPTSFFTKAFYATPVIRHSGVAAIFKNSLSRHYTNAQGLLGFTQGSGIDGDTTLFNLLLCRKKAAKKRGFEKLLAAIFEQSWAIGILDKAQEGAIDSTGIDTHHLSYHFVNCTKRPSYFRRTWPKITIVCDTATHLIASCIVTRGPSYGFGLFEQAVGKAYKQVRFKRMLADGGYDSETNHRIAREIFGMETMIKLNLRGFNIEPKGEHRIETKEKFNKKIYNNRRQIESVFSRNKRLLGSALRNRTEISRKRECLLRVLTHNLMIIRRAA